MYKLRNNYSTPIRKVHKKIRYKALMKANIGIFDYMDNDMDLIRVVLS